MKNHIQALVFAMFAIAITGCATTTPLSKVGTTDAKQALSDAMRAQLRQSFGYQSDIHISNAIREQALGSASDSQKRANDDIMTACEDEHDAAYAALVKKLMHEQGVSVDAVEKTDEFDTIKQIYQSCVDERTAIIGGDLQFDSEAFFKHNQNMSIDEQFDLLYAELQNHESVVETTRAANIASYQAAHDGQHTDLDAKKAKLLSAYLISPTQLSITGNYQPLAGKFSALPMVQYESKNLKLDVNQPLYIDLKQGIIYLWADNFAMIVSQQIDQSLGDKWHNKWLAFELNDGSLPSSFVNDLLRFIIDAKKQSFDSLNVTAFELVGSDQVLATPYLTANLSAHAIDTIKGTGSIVRMQPDADDRAYARYLFADTLYRSIVDHYAEFAEPNFGNIERSIIEGDSIIEVVNAHTVEEPTPPEEVKINSKLFVYVLLNALNQISQSYQADLQMGVSTDEGVGQQVLWHYGLKSGGISWIHQRKYLGNPLLPKDSKLHHEQPMIVDIFTSITHVLPEPFARLPSAYRTPTAENTVKVSDYGQDLIARLKSGDDEYSKMLLTLLTGSDPMSAEVYENEEQFELPSLPDDTNEPKEDQNVPTP